MSPGGGAPGHLATARGKKPRQPWVRAYCLPPVRIHRFLSLTDLVVLVVVAVAIFLPKRPHYALDAYKLDVDERADLSATEASVFAHPDDGGASAKLSRGMVRAGMLDWGIEV